MGKGTRELFKCTEDRKKSKIVIIQQLDPSYRLGRWEVNEHGRFLKACYKYKNDWEKIEDYIMTRSIPQIRSHAQKYLIKLSKKYRVKLSQKKFSKPTAKHLDLNTTNSNQIDDISKMNKYDINIFDMFKYYNRDFNIKTEDSTNVEDINIGDQIEKRKYSGEDSLEIKETPSINLHDVNINNTDSIMEQSENYNKFNKFVLNNCNCNDRVELLIDYLWELNKANKQTLRRLYLIYSD